MAETDGEDKAEDGRPPDLPAVERRLSELQQRKRKTVRWHMSRNTAERAIAAIAQGSLRPSSGQGKPRRRKRHKRLL
jgi:hypothetical protein